jgi:hypothetical protein
LNLIAVAGASCDRSHPRPSKCSWFAISLQIANNSYVVLVVVLLNGGPNKQEISGIALRHVQVTREYQHALDEARNQATRFGIVDERQEIVYHWQDAKSWIVPPIAVSCDLLGGGAGFELPIGHTRIGHS